MARLNAFGEQHIRHVAQEARETPTVVGLVASGLGVGIVPASLRSVKVKGVL